MEETKMNTTGRPPLDLDTLVLDRGAHDGPDEGGCVMEWAAYLANEPWSDQPACVCPTIRSFMVSWNDTLGDEDRQRLKPYIPRVLNTNHGSETALRRSYMVADWFIREFTPAWLDLARLTDEAAELRALPEIVDKSGVHSSGDALGRASARGAAAGDAALAAARAAAGDAALAAARAAAGDAALAAARAAAGAAAGDAALAAARAAAWDAAGDAAGDAALAAAGDAAGDAALAAARAAAWDAAGDAAWDAAGDAAWDAAGAALRPTVVALQASAFHLLDRMIEVQP